jgi:hypothetical protein
MTSTGDRNYFSNSGNNGIFPVSAPAGAYPFVAGNDNVPGVVSKTPALVAMGDGARLQGTPVLLGASTGGNVAASTSQGAGSQNFVQQAVSPAGVGSAATLNTLENAGVSGVGTVGAGMGNGQQEHGVAVHALGF